MRMFNFSEFNFSDYLQESIDVIQEKIALPPHALRLRKIAEQDVKRSSVMQVIPLFVWTINQQHGGYIPVETNQLQERRDQELGQGNDAKYQESGQKILFYELNPSNSDQAESKQHDQRYGPLQEHVLCVKPVHSALISFVLSKVFPVRKLGAYRIMQPEPRRSSHR